MKTSTLILVGLAALFLLPKKAGAARAPIDPLSTPFVADIAGATGSVSTVITEGTGGVAPPAYQPIAGEALYGPDDLPYILYVNNYPNPPPWEVVSQSGTGTFPPNMVQDYYDRLGIINPYSGAGRLTAI